MNLTLEQKAIVEFVRAGRGDLLIEALAGSGKTSTLIEALKTIPQRSILICAFNKRIAEEIKTKLPKLPRTHVAHVKTFHALGLSIVKSRFPGVEVSNDATENLISDAAQKRGVSLAYPLRRAAVKLLRTYKEVESPTAGELGIAVEPEDLLDVGHEYDLFGKLRDPQIVQVVEVVIDAYEALLQPGLTIQSIDFCDMVWLPLALRISPPSRYQAIVVDEWQDISAPQLALINQLIAPGGRLIMAGDIRQAIYGWRGGIGETVRSDMADRGSKMLPLTTSFRCSKAVITEAQALVPEIQAWDQANDGSVLEVGLRDVPRMIMGAPSEEIHTFVLSRTNADLLDAALFLYREGVKFQLNAGAQMLEPLFELLGKLNLSSVDAFKKSLGSWYGVESARAEASNATAWRERLDEQFAMLSAVVAYVEPRGIERLLKSILQAGTTGVLLSTVHKVKGLEADRVFLLKQTFQRHQPSRQPVEAFTAGRAIDSIGTQAQRLRDSLTPREREVLDRRFQPVASPSGLGVPNIASMPSGMTIGVGGGTVELRDLVEDRIYDTLTFGGLTQEELNIEYVAITRSRDHLIWVDLELRTYEYAKMRGRQEGASRWYLFKNTRDELQATSTKPLVTLSLEDVESLWSELEGEGVRLDRLGRLDESKAIVKYAIALKAHYDEMRAKE